MAAFTAGVTYGKVSHKADRVLVALGGPSMASVTSDDLKKAACKATIVVVNQVIKWFPGPVHVWFTLDPDDRTRPLMRKRLPYVHYYAAVPKGYGSYAARLNHHRNPADNGVTYLHRLEGDGPRRSRLGLSDDPTGISTGNSGWGALGLAYLMRPTRIGILGLDCTMEPYAFGDGAAPRKSFDHLPYLFSTAVEQLKIANIQVVNGSPNSTVTCFPRMTPSEVISWLCA